MTTPSVARMVHYVSAGSKNGEFPSTCRAAVITEVQDASVTDGEPQQQKVGLVALNPTGFFFHSIADGGCVYDDAAEPAPMTWHWPERV